jgi:hypothetical protein
MKKFLNEDILFLLKLIKNPILRIGLGNDGLNYNFLIINRTIFSLSAINYFLLYLNLMRS